MYMNHALVTRNSKHLTILVQVPAVYFLNMTDDIDAWEVPRSEIEVGVKLGQGNYGAVFRGQLSVMAMSPRIYTHKQEMEFEGKSSLTVAVKMLRCKCP